MKYRPSFGALLHTVPQKKKGFRLHGVRLKTRFYDFSSLRVYVGAADLASLLASGIHSSFQLNLSLTPQRNFKTRPTFSFFTKFLCVLFRFADCKAWPSRVQLAFEGFRGFYVFHSVNDVFVFHRIVVLFWGKEGK